MSRIVDIEAMPFREKMNPLFAAGKGRPGANHGEDSRSYWTKSKTSRARRSHSVCRDRIANHLWDDGE